MNSASNFRFGPNESLVRAPFYSLRLRPEVPFKLGDVGFDHTPWVDWSCDRFVAFFDLATLNRSEGYEGAAAFFKQKTPEAAEDLACYLQGYYSFDGALAYIPASHAEDFYAFFEGFVRDALSGMKDRENGDASQEFALGSDESDVVSYWGTTVPDGLFLLFAMSCDVIGEDWFESALRRYPKRDEITPPEGATVFDPKYAYFHQDSHLADNLSPDRNEDDPMYVSFVNWAVEKGYLKAI